LKKRGFNNYTINGNIVVDRILKFENLQVELDDVARRLGICDTLSLPFTKINIPDEIEFTIVTILMMMMRDT